MAYLSPQNPRVPRYISDKEVLWLVLGMFTTVVVLELVTLIDHVFSYLYVGPILLANLRLTRSIAVRLTWLASVLTIFNLWVPGSHIITTATLINRLIAVFAIVVTQILSSRNRQYEEAIAQEKAKLQFQEQLTRLREDFVTTLTHDLKTPLLGAIETLKAFQQERFGKVTVAQQKVLSTMARSQQSSLQLVETLLDVYRNDAEGVRLERAPINLVEMIERVVDTLSNLASNYQVSIHFMPNVQQCWVDGDALQLQRVVSNLLMNAITHSPIDGKVEVVLEPQAANLNSNDSEYCHTGQQIKILDEGPGIQAEELPQLFERFYQGFSNRQAKGSGLGLYLSRQIVEAHGGTIWAENRTPYGALFGFRIPVST